MSKPQPWTWNGNPTRGVGMEHTHFARVCKQGEGYKRTKLDSYRKPTSYKKHLGLWENTKELSNHWIGRVTCIQESEKTDQRTIGSIMSKQVLFEYMLRIWWSKAPLQEISNDQRKGNGYW